MYVCVGVAFTDEKPTPFLYDSYFLNYQKRNLNVNANNEVCATFGVLNFAYDRRSIWSIVRITLLC